MKKLWSNQMTRYTLFCCMIVMVISLFNIFSGNANHFAISMGKESLHVEGSDGNTVTLQYEDICSVMLVNQIDFGEKCEGYESKVERSGIWKNDRWGEYDLYVNPQLEQCIVFQATDRILVVNYEREDSTQALFEGFYEFFVEKGLEEQIEFIDTSVA